MFYSFLYVLDRWTASATSYTLLLIPVATFLVAAWLLDERITMRFLVGSVVVVLGVWLGALSQAREKT
jgi:drug/metabolite transporter (DMT)-like permease